VILDGKLVTFFTCCLLDLSGVSLEITSSEVSEHFETVKSIQLPNKIGKTIHKITITERKLPLQLNKLV
jgi:hypothetical protein